MLTARLEKRVRDLVLKREEEHRRRREEEQRLGDGFSNTANATLPSSRAIQKLCAAIEARGFTREDVKRCVLDVLVEESANGPVLNLEDCFDRLLMFVDRNRLPRAFRGGAVTSSENRKKTEDEQLVLTVEKPTTSEREEANATSKEKEKEKEEKERERNKMMKEREEMIRAANEMRKKKQEEKEKEEAKAFALAQKRMVAYMSSSSSSDSSSDSEDSLENFGLSEEEIARKNSHKRNVKMYTENRAEFVSELRTKLKEAKKTAQEEKRKAGKKVDKKRAKELAEEVKKILNIAETFKIGEKELEEEDKVPTSENVKKEEVEVEEKEHARLEKEEEEGEVENNETKRDVESDEDDNFQILDVFGDDEPEALKLTPEDEAKRKRKTIEASVVVGPVLNVEGTVGTAMFRRKFQQKSGQDHLERDTTLVTKALLARCV